MTDPTYEELMARPGGRGGSITESLRALQPGAVVRMDSITKGKSPTAIYKRAQLLGLVGQFSLITKDGVRYIVRHRESEA